jgi:hypothetical protein
MRGGQPVLERESYRDRVRSLARDQEIKPPWFDWIKIDVGRQDEDARLLLRLKALGGADQDIEVSAESDCCSPCTMHALEAEAVLLPEMLAVEIRLAC